MRPRTWRGIEFASGGLEPRRDRLGQPLDVGHLVVDLCRHARPYPAAPRVHLDLDGILEQQRVTQPPRLGQRSKSRILRRRRQAPARQLADGRGTVTMVATADSATSKRVAQRSVSM